jgi:hypothetical protein
MLIGSLAKFSNFRFDVGLVSDSKKISLTKFSKPIFDVGTILFGKKIGG